MFEGGFFVKYIYGHSQVYRKNGKASTEIFNCRVYEDREFSSIRDVQLHVQLDMYFDEATCEFKGQIHISDTDGSKLFGYHEFTGKEFFQILAMSQHTTEEAKRRYLCKTLLNFDPAFTETVLTEIAKNQLTKSFKSA